MCASRRQLWKLPMANMANSIRSLNCIHLQPYFYRCFHTRRRCMKPGRISCPSHAQPWTLCSPHSRTLVTQQIGPQMPSPPNEADGPESAKKKEAPKHDWGETVFKMAEAALTTFASVAILGCVTVYQPNCVLLILSQSCGLQLH